MRRFLRENGLSLALFGLFLVFLTAQSLTGLRVYNADAAEHGERPIGYVAYLGTAHFVEAVFARRAPPSPRNPRNPMRRREPDPEDAKTPGGTRP